MTYRWRRGALSPLAGPRCQGHGHASLLSEVQAFGAAAFRASQDGVSAESAAPGTDQNGRQRPGLERPPSVQPGYSIDVLGEPRPRALDLCGLGARRLQLDRVG